MQDSLTRRDPSSPSRSRCQDCSWQPRDWKHYKYDYSEDIHPATRSRLVEYFRPHNKELYEYIGLDFGWEHD